MAAICNHFPSNHHLLREFLDDSWWITLDRIDRGLSLVEDSPSARLDEIVATVIASQNPGEFAQLAMRDHTRLNRPARAPIEQQRLAFVEHAVTEGVRIGEFTSAEPAEAARAILAVTWSFAVLRPAAVRPMHEIIPLAQRFARSIACA